MELSNRKPLYHIPQHKIKSSPSTAWKESREKDKSPNDLNKENNQRQNAFLMRNYE